MNTQNARHMLQNEFDMLSGNIARLELTDDIIEFEKHKSVAKKRIREIGKIKTENRAKMYVQDLSHFDRFFGQSHYEMCTATKADSIAIITAAMLYKLEKHSNVLQDRFCKEETHRA